MFEISPQVIHEVIDGETMLVRLDSGNYYNMNATGGQIWSFIEKGASESQIVSDFTALYGLDKNIVGEQISIFIKQLIAEELISPNGNSPDAKIAFKSESLQQLTNLFEPPLINKYSDMQELLILDPIHDVSDAGWPNPKSENDNNG
ncbi:MAG: PqqD family peptide modification chaperone [Deltaproteobacteria bacterium]|nr:PqqD family peptide modification chaperone [Deltaproteobacteria bacterium]